MKRILVALGGVALFAGALVIGPHANAAPTPNQDVSAPDVSPGLLSAMQRDLHLDAAQARARLGIERTARSTEVGLRARLGTGYGGAWLTTDGRLVVGITGADRAGEVRSAGAEPKLVARSARQLDAVRTVLDGHASRAARGVHSWYVDAATNSVVVTADAAAAADAFVTVAGVDRAAVRTVVATTDAPRPMADVRGGDQYVINGNTLCSIGFSVVGGFVTAGHCGGVGSTTAGYNGAAQGTVRGSTFPGNDYAWVQVNSGWTPQPWVNNYSGGNVGVAGSQEAGIGASVCRSGRTTGWRCGTIQAKNATVNYPQGAVYGLTQSNACAEGGDSGGSWISGDQAQGTTSGGSGNCTTGGTMFFQPVNATLAHFGLSLVTTRGGSTSRITGYAGKCIDVPGGNSADGQYLNTWDCNGGNNQNWTFAGDGTVRALGKCMDVAWGSRDNGAVIQLVGCNGNPAQQFVLSGAGDLVNPQSNKCVDVKDWDTNNGARLQQWDCSGGANQKWHRG